MGNRHGDFIWYELLTTNADAAQAFYGPLLDWTFTDSGLPGGDYRLISAADVDGGPPRQVAGMLQLTASDQAGGARPVWLGYIGVDDVDATVERVQAAGGGVMISPRDIPGVGRFAMVTDPDGAPFYVMRGTSDEPSLAFAADKPRPGHCAWNELVAKDQAGAWRFYGDIFGWKKDGHMDMGDRGTYDFIGHGGMIGAIEQQSEGVPGPVWNYFFRVVDIDAAMTQISASGGTLVTGPHPVPGDDHILVGLDSAGAAFCLVGTRAAA